MTTPNQQVRRATVDDVPKLVALWKEDKLPWMELEKNFKEFQVIEAAGGKLLAAIGFQVLGHEGRLHSEVFAHFDQSDPLREKLWDRAQIMAKNHGLIRIWTQIATPFWRSNGFQTATPEVSSRLPASFAGNPQPWLYVQLKEDIEPVSSIDQEFTMFKEAERERTEKIFRHARLLKTVAIIMAIALAIVVAIWAVSFLKLQGRVPGR